MRTASLAVVLVTAIVPAASLLGACGSNVTGTGGAGGSTGSTGGQSSNITTNGSTTVSSSGGMTSVTSSSGGMTSVTSSSGGMTSATSSSGGMTSVTSSTGATTSVSVSSSSGGFDAGPTCPNLGNPCTECLSTSCASTYCSCYGNLACDQLDQCVGACTAGDQTCLQTCLTAHKDGISAAYLLSSCSDQNCEPACPGNSTTLDACQVCLFSQCVPEMNNCLADPECVPLIACWNGCNGSSTCITQCNATYSAGVTDGQAVALCSSSSCQGACP